jgi:hypothetical protein
MCRLYPWGMETVHWRRYRTPKGGGRGGQECMVPPWGLSTNTRCAYWKSMAVAYG